MPVAAYYKQVLAIDNVTWTPVIPNVPSSVAGVNYLGIKNPSSFPIKIRTNSTDPATEDTIYPGAVEVVASSPWANSRPDGNVRFLSGVAACFLQTTSGTADAIVTGLL